MAETEIGSLVPDSRNRISLGKLAEGVSRFEVTVNEKDDTIILRPMVDIPRRELWLWENKEKMAEVESGFHDVAMGKIFPIGNDIQAEIDAEISRMKDNNEL